MKDFTNKEWKEVCKRFDKIKQFLPESEIRPYLSTPINELGAGLSDFKDMINNSCNHIYEHIFKICCLENATDNVNHWRHEILMELLYLMNVKLKKNMKKDKLLMTYLIQPVLDDVTFKPLNDDGFVKSMEKEIANANKNKKDIRLKKESEYIQKYILPNITDIRIANADRIANLMKRIYSGIISRDEEAIGDALDQFIEEKVEL